LLSAFVVSVLSIIRKVYEPEAMARAKEGPVGFAWEDTKNLGQDAVREVASQLWHVRASWLRRRHATQAPCTTAHATPESVHTWSVSKTTITTIICISSQVRVWGRSPWVMC
jgi:hypothetical protein